MKTAAKTVIYHNPRCSKSRETLELLREAGVEPQIVEYLKAPPTAAELDQICRKLGIEPAALVRFKEPQAKELGLGPKDQRPRAEWLRLLAEHPVLIERPIVVRGARARLGRPPDAVRELLD
ncbi:MAG TPA: arsenate reductase (glutaredoxin) [Solimonas sp.]|nr:arsenate reductase (glutaredoxin) [Solimonas sp.]